MLRKLFRKARQVARDEQGISAVEYAILGALVGAWHNAGGDKRGSCHLRALGQNRHSGRRATGLEQNRTTFGPAFLQTSSWKQP